MKTLTLEPMLCQLVPALPDGPRWIYNIKWDGHRVIGRKLKGKGASLTSRSEKLLNRTLPAVLQSLEGLRCKTATVDGEVVAIGPDGQPSFQLLQGHRSSALNLRHMLFDVLEIDGKDVTGLPAEKHRSLLQKIIPSGRSLLAFSKELRAPAGELMKRATAAGLEGIVAKYRGSLYKPGERSTAWVKWKAERQDVFFIGGFIPNGGAFEELTVGRKVRGRLEYVSSGRAGFTALKRGQVMGALTPLKVSACPFANLPETGKSRWGRSVDAEKMASCRWVKPTLKAQVAFVEWTEGNKLRHSRFLALATPTK